MRYFFSLFFPDDTEKWSPILSRTPTENTHTPTNPHTYTPTHPDTDPQPPQDMPATSFGSLVAEFDSLGLESSPTCPKVGVTRVG